MNSGGPGDHWSTDIFRWNLPAFGEPSDTLIREHWGQRDGPWVPGDLQDRGVRVQAVTELVGQFADLLPRTHSPILPEKTGDACTSASLNSQAWRRSRHRKAL